MTPIFRLAQRKHPESSTHCYQYRKNVFGRSYKSSRRGFNNSVFPKRWSLLNAVECDRGLKTSLVKLLMESSPAECWTKMFDDDPITEICSAIRCEGFWQLTRSGVGPGSDRNVLQTVLVECYDIIDGVSYSINDITSTSTVQEHWCMQLYCWRQKVNDWELRREVLLEEDFDRMQFTVLLRR